MNVGQAQLTQHPGCVADSVGVHLDGLHCARSQVVQRALRNQPALVHDTDVTADLVHLSQQMAGDEHRRTIGCEVGDQMPDFTGPLGVQPVGRLVQHHQLPGHQQCAGDRQPLPHAQ